MPRYRRSLKRGIECGVELDPLFGAIVEDLVAMLQVGVTSSSRHTIEFPRHFVDTALNDRADCELDRLQGPFAYANIKQLRVEELEQASPHFASKDLVLSHFCSGLSAHLGGLSFESQGAFSTQR